MRYKQKLLVLATIAGLLTGLNPANASNGPQVVQTSAAAAATPIFEARTDEEPSAGCGPETEPETPTRIVTAVSANESVERETTDPLIEEPDQVESETDPVSAARCNGWPDPDDEEDVALQPVTVQQIPESSEDIIPSSPATECETDGDQEVCFRPVTDIPTLAARAPYLAIVPLSARGPMPAASDPYHLCNNSSTLIYEGWRFESCITRSTEYWLHEGSKQTGHGFIYESTVVKIADNGLSANVRLRVSVTGDTAVARGQWRLQDGAATCDYGCSNNSITPYPLNLRTMSAGSPAEYVVNVPPGALANGVNKFRIRFTYRLSKNDYPRIYERVNLASEVRCDDRAVYNKLGCILPDFTGTYFPNFFGQAPKVADHIQAAFATGMPGSFESGVKLHRLQDSVLAQQNADIACPSRVSRQPKPYDESAGQAWSCDEYPMRSTREGAYTTPVTGTDRPVRTYPNCRIRQVPVVTSTQRKGVSVCNVPANENSSAGGYLSSFYNAQRILQDEGFWVEPTVGTMNPTRAISFYKLDDVSPGHQFYNEITYMVNSQIIRPAAGMRLSRFEGTHSITRAQAARFLWRSTQVKNRDNFAYCESPYTPFSDVGTSHAYCGYIGALSRSGVINGYSDGSFHPNDLVDRQAMAAFLFRMKAPAGTSTTCTGTVRTFTDIPKTHQFCAQIEWLAARNVIKGTNGLFKGSDKIDHQALAAFLYRILSI